MKKKNRYPYLIEEIVFVLIYLMLLAFVVLIILEFAFQDWDSTTAIGAASLLALVTVAYCFKKEVVNYWCHISFSENEIISYRWRKPLCAIDLRKPVYFAEMCLNQYRGQTKVVIISNDPLFDKERAIAKKDYRSLPFRYSAYYSPTRQIIVQKKHVNIENDWIQEKLPYADMEF